MNNITEQNLQQLLNLAVSNPTIALTSDQKKDLLNLLIKYHSFDLTNEQKSVLVNNLILNSKEDLTNSEIKVLLNIINTLLQKDLNNKDIPLENLNKFSKTIKQSYRLHFKEFLKNNWIIIINLIKNIKASTYLFIEDCKKNVLLKNILIFLSKACITISTIIFKTIIKLFKWFIVSTSLIILGKISVLYPTKIVICNNSKLKKEFILSNDFKKCLDILNHWMNKYINFVIDKKNYTNNDVFKWFSKFYDSNNIFVILKNILNYSKETLEIGKSFCWSFIENNSPILNYTLLSAFLLSILYGFNVLGTYNDLGLDKVVNTCTNLYTTYVKPNNALRSFIPNTCNQLYNYIKGLFFNNVDASPPPKGERLRALLNNTDVNKFSNSSHMSSNSSHITSKDSALLTAKIREIANHGVRESSLSSNSNLTTAKVREIANLYQETSSNNDSAFTLPILKTISNTNSNVDLVSSPRSESDMFKYRPPISDTRSVVSESDMWTYRPPISDTIKIKATSLSDSGSPLIENQESIN